MLLQDSSVASSNEFVKCLSKTQQAAASSIKLAQLQHAQYHDKHQLQPQCFFPGDLVLLNFCFITTAMPCRKLDYRFLGPFAVEWMVGDNAVMLCTGTALGRVHPVFNISLLVPYHLPSFAISCSCFGSNSAFSGGYSGLSFFSMIVPLLPFALE
ncbi:hypothetical protein O181_025148 [Austropuccinia psidii MF-1]|uniref:Tf2-1-like SH3-like domain-containing protein n=1 Tax=Austropuccinia psidii MF-1 TaxID=1389203 RepID=A0A9Q3CK68_9BASI|nr:hypothetical protein [Austropuccinia psidii MF-1]